MKCKPSEDVCLEHCLPLVGERFCADGCRHPTPRFEVVRDSILIIDRIRVMTRYRCGACHAWLSLGPSNDAGCEVEIRAAELARHLVERGDFVGFATNDEMSGWSSHMLDRDPIRRVRQLNERAVLAGYLARCIATQGEERGGE